MHCISVYLFNKTEVRDEKLEHIINDKKFNDIKLTELPQNIVACTDIQDIKEFSKNRTVAFVTTDYFGGVGEQSSELWINGVCEYDSQDFPNESNPINIALNKIGVTRQSGMDEFDSIRLGNYRSNDDFEN